MGVGWGAVWFVGDGVGDWVGVGSDRSGAFGGVGPACTIGSVAVVSVGVGVSVGAGDGVGDGVGSIVTGDGVGAPL